MKEQHVSLEDARVGMVVPRRDPEGKLGWWMITEIIRWEDDSGGEIKWRKTEKPHERQLSIRAKIAKTAAD
jgi:hypothetical protein